MLSSLKWPHLHHVTAKDETVLVAKREQPGAAAAFMALRKDGYKVINYSRISEYKNNNVFYCSLI